MKNLLLIIVIVCGLGIGFFFVPNIVQSAPWNAAVSAIQGGDDKAVTEQLSYIADLSVLDYKYSNAANYTDYRDIEVLKSKLDIPFTKKQIVMLYDGDIKIGVDASKITADVRKGLNNKVNKVIIGLPPLKITSNDIDRNSIEWPLEKNNFLNSLETSDYTKIEEAGKDTMAESVKKNGILDKAKEELKIQMEGYAKAVYGSDVEVEFEDVK